MADAAHGEPPKHEVYSKPFKVKPKYSFAETPSNYHEYPDGDKLPDKMKIWLVQDTGEPFGSVVARSYGFTDSPDAEIIALGFNMGKEYGAIGIGRHGNYLQWGYWGAPSQMTEAGKKLFVNCICYINKFDGKAPLVRQSSSHRTNAIRLAALINRITDDEFFARTFPENLKDKYGNDPNGLVKYYKDDFELIYRDTHFQIDDELKSLGISSNREIDTLQSLINLLSDSSKADLAKKLLDRYTEKSFQSKAQWQTWFDENKDRIYFTDVGGYKFLVAPEGYLE
jgi:hypothetical protein